MTDRPASATAVLVCQARAAADGRYVVGRFSDPIARELLDDAELDVVDRVRAERVPTVAADRLAYEMVRRTAMVMAPRTVAIDDAIREHGAHQVVILGAGLDARAWRMTELDAATVIEVDHRRSQADKTRRLGGLTPTAGRVVPVAVDLGSEPLAPALAGAAYDPGSATTWVWEGVIPYLAGDEVRATLRQVAELSAADSRLVLTYQATSLTTGLVRRVMRGVWRVSGQRDVLAGEPWKSLWRPQPMRDMLGDLGFDVVTDVDLLTLSGGMGLPADGGGSLRNGRVAVAVRHDR